jgi:hypothetical protein
VTNSAGSVWGPYWARWLDGSYTPASMWSPERDRDVYRQVLNIRETDAERGWLGRFGGWPEPYWGCAL